VTAVPSRVLVTGAAGAIGTAVAARLAEVGIAVTGLSLSGPFPPGADRVIEGDATITEVVAEALEGVDAVVHLAAIPHPSLGTPDQVFTTNVLSTFRVLAAAGEHGVRRAVLASSVNAYGVPLNRHSPLPAYFPLDELLPRDIEDAYSLSKTIDEMTAAMAWRHWGIDTVALRFPLVRTMDELRKALPSFAADPSAYMRVGWGYLDARDAAEAVHLALTVPLTGAHVIGLSAHDTMVDLPTAQLLAEHAAGVPIRSPLLGRAAAIDTSRARTVLGFEPRYSVHAGEP
jgi:nucleoside-diphosphate-sugar epimerase